MVMDIIRVVISKFTGGDVPKWSGTGRIGEKFTDQVAMQHYGFASNMPLDSVGIAIAVGDKALLFASDNAEKRPELNEGETCIYFDKNNYIKIQAGGKITIQSDNEINLGGDRSGLERLIDERIIAKLNSHVHTGNIGFPSSPPIVTFTVDGNSTTKTKGR